MNYSDLFYLDGNYKIRWRITRGPMLKDSYAGSIPYYYPWSERIIVLKGKRHKAGLVAYCLQNPNAIPPDAVMFKDNNKHNLRNNNLIPIYNKDRVVRVEEAWVDEEF